MSKTLTISDETYDMITNFCKELVTQDSRSTRIPYVYVIRDVERVYGIDPDFSYDDGYVWMDDASEDTHYTDETLLEYMLDNYDDFDNTNLNDDSVIALLSSYGFNKVYYVEFRTIKNIFLTEKGAIEHLKSYNYQYNDPDIKVIHLSGNTEILGLITTLNEIIH